MSFTTDTTREFLYRVRECPEILPLATGWQPDSEGSKAITRRGREEVHKCALCDQDADAAMVAATLRGPRWLDLCWSDYHKVVMANWNGP